jgi:hypothetical protein
MEFLFGNIAQELGDISTSTVNNTGHWTKLSFDFLYRSENGFAISYINGNVLWIDSEGCHPLEVPGKLIICFRLYRTQQHKPGSAFPRKRQTALSSYSLSTSSNDQNITGIE